MSVTTPTIVSGDDVSLSVTLKKNGSTFDMSGATSVKASVVSENHTNIFIAAVTQTEVAGADWANSLVVVNFTSAQTAAMTFQGRASLEIEVDDGGKTTFFAQVQAVKGLIT